jgi:integrase
LFPSSSATGHLVEIKKAWKAIRRRAGIPDAKRSKETGQLVPNTGLRPHDLRHSFASFLASSGHGLPTIGALLGHTRPETTARYAHLFDEVKLAAANKVGSIMAGLVAKPGGKRKPLKAITGGRR